MGTVEDVRIAKRTGFCCGVRGGHRQGEGSRRAGADRTLGQVVHNEGVVAELQAHAASDVADLAEDVTEGTAVVIRAHGVRPGRDRPPRMSRAWRSSTAPARG